MTRDATAVVALLFLALAPARLAAQDEEPPAPPNILLILADDMGWGDVSSHGNPRVRTPNLDALAVAGARFDRFFVSPVCAPTRASLLTGRYHLRTGVSWVTRGLETMRAEEFTLAEDLRARGYDTGLFGKWHNGAHYPHTPDDQGFETFLGFRGGHWNRYFDTPLDRFEHGERSVVPTRGYISDVLTDAAIEFVRKGDSLRRTFFCQVAYNAPHAPFQVPDADFDRVKARNPDLDDRNVCIYAMVENLDRNVGRLLRALEDSKIADSTIVVFLTDNGPNGGDRFNGGMRGAKGSVHEGGVRVPCFIRWPGKLGGVTTSRPSPIPPGTVVTPIASHIDLFPTLLQLCGIRRADRPPIDGVSLVPLLLGQVTPQDWPDRLIFTHQSRQGEVASSPGSVRSQRYRAVNIGNRWELYDLIDDPAQARDLAADRSEDLARLKTAYEDWFADVTRTPVVRPPIPVGHAEAPDVTLPAPEAYFSGGVRYKGRAGWAHDWATNWTTPDDAIAWELDVVHPGRFAVVLHYACPPADVGSTVRVEAAGRSLEVTVTRPHDPPPDALPDRVPRAEVPEKPWATLDAGALDLPAGRARLTLRRPGSPALPLWI